MKNKIAIQASNNIEKNKEIIKILENLGGKNNNFLTGYTSEHSCYCIEEDNLITCFNMNCCYNRLKKYKLYTLEEYKKEFMEKEIKITVPEGYEIDEKNSTFEKIVFKKIEKKLTYKDIAKELFTSKKHYYTNDFGTIKETANKTTNFLCFLDSNNAPTQHQLERLLAINKLMNVAYYLNDGWEPDWKSLKESKYCLCYDYQVSKINIGNLCIINYGLVYFKSKELAQQAIEILGEETIKLALGVI